MGTKIHENSGGKKYKDAIHDLKKVIYHRFVNIPLAIGFIFRLTPLYKRYSESLSIIHNFTRNVIKNRKEKIKDVDENYLVTDGDITEELNRDTRTAFLDLLILAQRKGLTDDIGIQEEVDTFMFRVHNFLFLFTL